MAHAKIVNFVIGRLKFREFFVCLKKAFCVL